VASLLSLHNFYSILILLLEPSSNEADETRVRKMAAEFCRRVPIMLVGFFFSCRKSTTWDRRLYFSSEGSRATDFITLKIHRPRRGLNPRILGAVPMIKIMMKVNNNDKGNDQFREKDKRFTINLPYDMKYDAGNLTPNVATPMLRTSSQDHE
jgi:hypothetical protein